MSVKTDFVEKVMLIVVGPESEHELHPSHTPLQRLFGNKIVFISNFYILQIYINSSKKETSTLPEADVYPAVIAL